MLQNGLLAVSSVVDITFVCLLQLSQSKQTIACYIHVVISYSCASQALLAINLLWPQLDEGAVAIGVAVLRTK